jgi:integrase
MPLKLHDPRKGKSPNYSIRGTYLGITVERTTGTADRKVAARILAKVKDDIERGAYAKKGGLTFAAAALAYVKNTGVKDFIKPIAKHFGNTPLIQIDQFSIDDAATTLYPNASPATRNRQVYTPVSAILKFAKVDYEIKRPKGSQGVSKTEWMTPEQAERLLDCAEQLDPEFRVFQSMLLYTGLRLSEALHVQVSDLDVAGQVIFIPKTKNELPRAVHVPPQLLEEFARHPRGVARPNEMLFRFHKNGHLYTLMRKAKTAAGLPNVTFHTFRHTWATWMRRFAKLDTKGLVGTGAWKDEKSASRYAHVVVTEEAQRSDMLPTLKRAFRAKVVE